uniref:Uncharacterized protein n=1 Tax=Rousettus aegyptiacus TaxID=9407 RepID=A0A7J8F1N9_ROUAE|nr:hypothetical protein HJG63_012322 [Rousettus aegyptiacus]
MQHNFPSLVRTETLDPDPAWLVGFALFAPVPVLCWSVISVSLVSVFEIVVSLNVIRFYPSSFPYRSIDSSFCPRLSCHCPAGLVPEGTRGSCSNFFYFYRYHIFFLHCSNRHGSSFLQTHSSTVSPQ